MVEIERMVQEYLRQGRSVSTAAEMLGLSRHVVRHRIDEARQRGLIPGEKPTYCAQCKEVESLQRQISDLTREVRKAHNAELTSTDIKEFIFGLKDLKPEPPEWLIMPPGGSGVLGVPAMLFSDFHWGERVTPSQVFDLNEYNLQVAGERLNRVVERSIDVLTNHMLNPNYPGIVLLLGGDLLSGDIHEELSATNVTPTMPAFVDLFSHMIKAVERYRDVFPDVCVIGTAGGNHGRTTKKVPSKNKAYTNWDWLLSQMLAKWFEKDPHVHFLISDSDQIDFTIYNTRYRLLHGDSFGGGQGFVGPFAPVARGDRKKRIAAASYDMGYDVLCMGHYHTYMPMGKIIANGSLVGYNEFAIKLDMDYDLPKQACWLTHPKWGVTYTTPIFAEDPKKANSQTWFSMPMRS